MEGGLHDGRAEYMRMEVNDTCAVREMVRE